MDTLCVVCGEAGTRTCLQCANVHYCSVDHQFMHWRTRHCNACSMAQLQLDMGAYAGLSRKHLRAAAISSVSSDPATALALCYLSLRASLRRSGSKVGQSQVQEILLLARLHSLVKDADGAAFFLTLAARTIAAEPYRDWSQSNAVFTYAAAELVAARRSTDAEAVYELHVAAIERELGPNRLEAAQVFSQLAKMALTRNDLQAAAGHMQQCADIRAAKLPGADRRVLEAHLNLGMLHAIMGKPEAAVAAYYDAREGAVMREGEDSLLTAAVDLKLGLELQRVDQQREALEVLTHAYEVRAGQLGTGHRLTEQARHAVNRLHTALGIAHLAAPDEAVNDGAGHGVADAGKSDRGQSDIGGLDTGAVRRTGGTADEYGDTSSSGPSEARASPSLILAADGGGFAIAAPGELSASPSLGSGRRQTRSFGTGDESSASDDSYETGSSGSWSEESGSGEESDDSELPGGVLSGGGGMPSFPWMSGGGGGGDDFDDDFGGGAVGGAADDGGLGASLAAQGPTADPLVGSAGPAGGDAIGVDLSGFGGDGIGDFAGAAGGFGPAGPEQGDIGIVGLGPQQGGMEQGLDDFGPGSAFDSSQQGGFEGFDGANLDGFGPMGAQGGGFSAGGMQGFGDDFNDQFGGGFDDNFGGPAGLDGGPAGGNAGDMFGGPGGPGGPGAMDANFDAGFGAGPMGGPDGGFGGFGGFESVGGGAGMDMGMGQDFEFGGSFGGVGGFDDIDFGGPEARSGLGDDDAQSGEGGGGRRRRRRSSMYAVDSGGADEPSAPIQPEAVVMPAEEATALLREAETRLVAALDAMQHADEERKGQMAERVKTTVKAALDAIGDTGPTASEDEAIKATREYLMRMIASAAASGGSAGAAVIEARSDYQMVKMVPAGDGTGLLQPGLVKVVPNPTKRHMRAVQMSAEEILRELHPVLFFLGVTMNAIKARKNAIRQMRLLAFGSMKQAIRLRQERRRRAQLFAMGVANGAIKLRDKWRRLRKWHALGAMVREIKIRNEARRRAMTFALGLGPSTLRAQKERYKYSRTFAVGVFVTLHRVKPGEPEGYKFKPKKVKKKKKKVAYKGPKHRPLHWDVMKRVKGTIWEDAPEDEEAEKVLSALFPDLTSMFEEKKPDKKKKAGATDKPKKAKAELIKFIDAKRSQNMQIALAQFGKMPMEDVREAVMRMDPAAINGEVGVQLLDDWFPEDTELKAAQGFLSQEGFDPSKLDKGERFVYEMAQVQRLRERIDALKMKIDFYDELESLEKDVDALVKATREIQAYELKDFLLNIVLPVGNRLNAGTRKADAAGIKLSSLSKLTTTKTSDNKMTLLYYIVRTLEARQPSMLKLPEMFEHAALARRVTLSALEAELRTAGEKTAVIKKTLADCEKDGDKPFIDVMGPWIGEADATVAKLQRALSRWALDYEDLVKMFGEKPSDMAPDEFFRLWDDFFKAFRDTIKKYKENKAKAEAAARKAIAQKKAEEERAARKAAKAGGRPKAKRGGGGQDPFAGASVLRKTAKKPQPDEAGRATEAAVAEQKESKPAAAGKEASVPLEQMWVELDAGAGDGSVYYQNAADYSSAWEVPVGHIVVSVEEAEAAEAAAAAAAAAGEASAADAAAQGDLGGAPESKGDLHPESEPAVAGDAAAEYADWGEAAGSDAVAGGGHGDNDWFEAYDDGSGSYYYENAITGETVWEVPEGANVIRE